MESCVLTSLDLSESPQNGEKRDVGTALLLAGLNALRAQGYAYAIIGWPDQLRFSRKPSARQLSRTPSPESIAACCETGISKDSENGGRTQCNYFMCILLS
jgi:hypothetical protein